MVSQHITSQTGELTAGLNDTVNNLKTVSVACNYITKFETDVCHLNLLIIIECSVFHSQLRDDKTHKTGVNFAY